MSKIDELRKCADLSDFARLLDMKPSSLSYILYKIPDTDKYSEFKIPKKSGGERKIQSPIMVLSDLQVAVAKLLHECIEEALPEKEKLPKDKTKQINRNRASRAISHGFVKGLSIKTNAEKHVGKRYVFNIDIADFFPSINFGRVYGYFIKSKEFSLTPAVAAVIAKIVCHKNALPQGSPASPIISNLIARILDIRLLSLAIKNKCTYTRYADDLTFSTNLLAFPHDVAFHHPETEEWNIGHKLKDVIIKSGFKINDNKTRMQHANSRKLVTGLIVNKFVNTRVERYRYARSMCHALFTTGKYDLPPHEVHEMITQEKDGKFEVVKKTPTLQQLEGLLNHIYDVKNFRNMYARDGYRTSRHDGMIKPQENSDSPKYPPINRNASYADESHKVSIDGIKNLYWKFLFYKHFYALKAPVLVFEGKTDNKYMHYAIKKLQPMYSELADIKKSPNKEKEDICVRKINFFNRTPIVSEMMKLAEGVGGQQFILLTYKRFMKKYRGPGKEYPVILIADNDDEGKKLVQAAAGNHKLTLTEDQKNGYAAIHVVENLYVIVLPKYDNKKTEMEDYFEQSVLDTLLDGKKFNRSNTPSDDGEHYGKSVFANQVIAKDWKNINFDRFKPLLNLIVATMKDYEAKH